MRALLLACVLFVTVGDRAQVVTPVQDTATPKQIAAMRAKLTDWAQLGYYREANAALPPVAAGEERVVFYGASVAERWDRRGSQFFPGKHYIDRGISGQTSAQMLVRFRQDVIDLHPAAVVILEGVNDISANMTPQMSENNWQSMAELAKVNGIRMIFTSITPSTDLPWHRGLHPAGKIRARNAWLKQYCASHALIYVDFYPALVNAEGGMKADLAVDGVHPTPKGYAVMAPFVQAGIDQALRGK
ncbi:MAG: GDSL-type esterase/lipase family protein [Acidobacteriaceae bacterium]